MRPPILNNCTPYGNFGRDPRGHVITVAYTALVSSNFFTLRAGTDAADAQWFPMDALPSYLAFDHQDILSCALDNVRRRLEDSNIARELLPTRFTLTQLQEVYEALLGQSLDKRNFRKWILTLSLVVPTDQELRGHHRPALLYEFTPQTKTGDAASRFLWTRRSRRQEGTSC